jgi:hypothetical protein
MCKKYENKTQLTNELTIKVHMLCLALAIGLSANKKFGEMTTRL